MIDEPLALLAEAFGGEPEPVLPDPGEAVPEIPAQGAAMQAAPVGTATGAVRDAA